jgi:hypothetical protein
MSENKSLLLIAVMAMVGIILVVLKSNNFFEGTQSLVFVIGIILSVILSIIFVMGRTGKPFSIKLLIVAVFVSAVFLGFGILKKIL